MKDLERKSGTGLDALKKKQEYDSLKNEVSKGIDDLLNTEKKETPVVPISRNRNWLAIAASLLFVAAAAYFLIPKSASPDKIYTSYFDTYPDVVSETLRGDEIERTQFMDAMKLYNASSYNEAITSFQKMGTAIDPSSKLYLAISYLATDKDKEALAMLNTIPAQTEVNDGVLWYKVMAHLKLDQKEKAKEYLQIISTSKHYKNSEAKEILQKLSK